MRTLTATHLAAQRGRDQKPVVRVLVRDKQARWCEVGWQATVNVQSSMCVSGSTIVVVTLSTGGTVRCRRVTDPTYLDPIMGEHLGWGWYLSDYTVTVVSGVLGWPYGDVCVSLNGSTLRCFFISSDGRFVQCRESTDGGATWGATVTVKALAGGHTTDYYRLASAGNNDVFWAYSDPGHRYVVRRGYAGGAWGSEVTLVAMTDTGGEFISCGGLAALWTGTEYLMAVSFWGVVLEDGNLRTAHVAVDGTVSGVQRVAPPGFAAPGFTPCWPSLLKTTAGLGSRYVLAYLDKFASGGISWANPVAILSSDFDHWSFKIPMAVDMTTYERRMNLCEFSNVVYLHVINNAHKLDLWYSGKAGFEKTIGADHVLSYEISERPGLGRLEVLVDNRDGDYDAPGVAGGDSPALRPLAQVVVDQGLVTAAGTERVECRPFLLWGVAQLRSAGRNWARLECVDGWELFRLWRPDSVYVFEARSVQWCIEELAARVGGFAVDFDADAAWASTIVEYLAISGDRTDWQGRIVIRAWGRWYRLDDIALAIDPRMDGYTALQALLALVGGVARWGNGSSQDVLYCFIPANAGMDGSVHTYQEGEIVAGEYLDSFAWPTRVRASGASVAYEAQSVANGRELGMEMFGLLYSSSWDAAAECHIAADSMQDDAEARKWGGQLETMPNVGLELLDAIAFTDSRVGAGFTGLQRRVNRLITKYDAQRAAWVQRVYLEGM